MEKEFQESIRRLKIINKYLPFEDNVVKIKVKDLLDLYDKIIQLENKE